ncbi:MAG: glycerophosphodiester phosphodiesterase family protein [Kangiellaceae bacterium]|jgi:glycerophosphoryl diester phosphodiesterase|nr:glycerophosphodiester phosphodiesterase family protein [Kangiellaceae bacterium]
MSRQANLPSVIAHRGLSAFAPENTIAAFQAAVSHGLSWIETDVMLTQDNVPVVFHDEHLGRLLGVNKTIDQCRFAELRQYRITTATANLESTDTVPTLVDTLAFCQQHQLSINLELKPSPSKLTQMVPAVVAVIRQFKTVPSILLSSYSCQLLHECYQSLSDYPRAYITDQLDQNEYRAITDLDRSIGLHSVHVHHSQLDRPEFNQLINEGYRLLCFTVNQPALAERCYQAGALGVFSDNGLLTL